MGLVLITTNCTTGSNSHSRALFSLSSSQSSYLSVWCIGVQGTRLSNLNKLPGLFQTLAVQSRRYIPNMHLTHAHRVKHPVIVFPSWICFSHLWRSHLTSAILPLNSFVLSCGRRALVERKLKVKHQLYLKFSNWHHTAGNIHWII